MKWICIAAYAAMVLHSAWAQASVPLPRPLDAPPGAHAAAPPAEVLKPSEPPKEAEPPPPSACRLALTDAVAIAPSIPAIKGPGACGGEDLVRLEAVVLADRSRVTVAPAAVMRCTMAAAVAEWIRNDVVTLVQPFGAPLREIDNFDSYACRGRNRVIGAILSEHGKANALDIRAFKLGDGRRISLTERSLKKGFREQLRHTACARFKTVLGPGSDWYHEDHVHVDLAERRSDYRLCRWELFDPLPDPAPLLPAARPLDTPADDAPSNKDKPAGKADGETTTGHDQVK